METFSRKDHYWMKRALALAKRALGQTKPNPVVGCIVLDAQGNFVGQGFHQKAGEPHAEVFALNQAGTKAKGGTLYVTLEPCSIENRTPPCAKLVAQSHIKRVVVATKDPNPKVNGSGIAFLHDKGLQAALGCEQFRADTLIAPFRTWITKKRPLVTAKIALSLDGKIGAQDKRIILSGSVIEKTTMRLRAEAGAILVGVNTILIDDPQLNLRGKYRDREPIRAVLDPSLRTPPSAKIFQTKGGPVWIFCHKENLQTPAAKKLEQSRAKLIPIPITANDLLDASEILSYFGKNEITAILIEGGAFTLNHFADSKLIDRWMIYRTPKTLGKYKNKTVSFDIGNQSFLKFQHAIQRDNDVEILALPFVNLSK